MVHGSSMVMRGPLSLLGPCVLLAATVTMSCAHTTVTADALLGEVLDNQIAALDKYQGESVIVTGRVEATGLKNFEETVYEGSAGYGSFVARAHHNTHQRAFISLKSETAAQGNVVCFFSDDARGDAAVAHEGEMVSLRGTVYRVKRNGPSAIVWMTSCEAAP